MHVSFYLVLIGDLRKGPAGFLKDWMLVIARVTALNLQNNSGWARNLPQEAQLSAVKTIIPSVPFGSVPVNSTIILSADNGSNLLTIRDLLPQ
jgi:hypothetical protein